MDQFASNLEKNHTVKTGFHQRRSRSCKSAYDLVKIKDRSRKRRHKLDGIGVRIIRTFPFSSDSAYASEAGSEAEEPTNHNAWN